MVDRLGDRLVLGLLIPTANTTVQPEFDVMRPSGVTNQTGRFIIPDLQLYGPGDATRLASDIASAIASSVEALRTCDPDAIALAYSTEYLAGGRASTAAIHDAIVARAGGISITNATESVPRALELFGARRVSVVTPYLPPANAHVKAFFEAAVYSVKAVEGARREAGTSAAVTTAENIRAAFAAIDGNDVDALIHVGSNLPVIDICIALEQALGKPVFGANQATFWAALRNNGIDDRIEGKGWLFSEF